MKPELKVGDVVCVNGTAVPVMVVTEVVRDLVHCRYFYEGEFKHVNFPAEALIAK